MSNLAGFWLCLTPIAWIVGAAILLDKEKKDYGPSLGASMLSAVPIWWAIYFAVRAI